MSTQEFRVYIHFWMYVFGAIPAAYMMFLVSSVTFYPFSFYSLMAIIIFVLGFFLFAVSFRGLCQTGPIVTVSDRGLFIGHPFCSLGWLDWEDILRATVDREYLLVDLSPKGQGKRRGLGWRLQNWNRWVGASGEVVVPLSLRRKVDLDVLEREIEKRLPASRFGN